jgi:uncharacterized protein YjbI with pentapeptide repeats
MLRNTTVERVKEKENLGSMIQTTDKSSYESTYLTKVGFNSQLVEYLPPELSDIVSDYLIPTLTFLDNKISQKENQKVANYFDLYPASIVNLLLMEWKKTASLTYLYYLPLDKWKDTDIQMAEKLNIMASDSMLHCFVLVKLLFAKNQQNEAIGLMYNKQHYDKMSFKNLNLAGVTMTGLARFSHTGYDDLVDFSGVNFGGAHLRAVNFSYVYLNMTSFFAADCAHGIFNEAVLIGADLSQGDFSHANFRRANLTNANLQQAILTRAELSYVKLNNADLTSANLEFCFLPHADMRGVKLFGANLHQATMTDVNFCDTDLSNVNFATAKVRNADFQGANLCGADLRFVTDLNTAKNISVANLSKANPCFKPLLDYLKALQQKNKPSLFKKEKPLDELAQSCWLTGANNFVDFQSRYLVLIEKLQTSSLSITNNFLKVLHEVRDNFIEKNSLIEASLSLKRRGSFSA